MLTTRAILGDIWDILMERVPRKMDIDKMEQDMLAVSVVPCGTATAQTLACMAISSLVCCCELICWEVTIACMAS